ncbi:MAG: hypothetical protein ABID87_00060 [Chloroflexota bacterium]
MRMEWLTRLIQVTTVTLTMIAVLQELEKPEEARRWHGTIARYVPYDFRPPTLEKLRQSYWNADTFEVFTPPVFGVGWGINFFSLLEKFRILSDYPRTEEEFLMPTESIREVILNAVVTD